MSKQLDILTLKPDSPMAKAGHLVELMELQKQIKEKIDEYKADLLETTQQLDVLSLKTGKYTVTRAKRVTPQVVNIAKLKKALDEKDIPYMMVEVFADHMSEVFKQAIKKGVELEGLEAKTTEYISVRIAAKDEEAKKDE